MPDATMKHCTKCKTEKPLDAFARNGWAKDGLQQWCRECRSEAFRNLNSSKAGRLARHSWGMARYNITPDDYDNMLSAQGGVCAICTAEPTQRRLSVDHDHSCCQGARSCGHCVRGLLCTKCNTAIGLLGDNPDRIGRAIRYLTGASA